MSGFCLGIRFFFAKKVKVKVLFKNYRFLGKYLSMKDFFRLSILSLCLCTLCSAPVVAGEADGGDVIEQVETFLSDTQEKLEELNPFGDVFDEDDEEQRDDPIEGPDDHDDDEEAEGEDGDHHKDDVRKDRR